MHIAICVPSLVEVAPGVPELCSNIHTHTHTHTHTHIHPFIYTVKLVQGGIARDRIYFRNWAIFRIIQKKMKIN
jgi:hypothetical protein